MVYSIILYNAILYSINNINSKNGSAMGVSWEIYYQLQTTKWTHQSNKEAPSGWTRLTSLRLVNHTIDTSNTIF